MTPTPSAVATAERILAGTPHAGIDYPELRHRIAFALTAQAQGHVKQETHNAAVRTIATQAGEIERLRSEAGYVAAADVIAHLTAQRDSIERATWAAALDLMAAMEADIAAEPRHSVGEVRGAHMLGAAIRARAAAGPSVFAEPFDAQGTP